MLAFRLRRNELQPARPRATRCHPARGRRIHGGDVAPAPRWLLRLRAGRRLLRIDVAGRAACRPPPRGRGL